MSDAAPAPRANQGQPAPRVDARLKVTGQARYAADFPVGRLAYGVLVTSSIAAGAVDGVKLEAARKLPGVLDVVSYGDVDKIKPPKFGNTSGTSIAPLHDKRIYHDGQIMALVVGDTFEAAREGAYLIEAQYRPKPAAAGFGVAGTETVDAVGKSQQHKEDPAVGDFDAQYEQAPVKLDAAYSTPTQHHNPIELFSTTAVWQDGNLTVYEPSQNVRGWQMELARQMGLEPDQVRVVSPYVGGAFGSKGPMSPRTAIVAEAARRIGRPVRCVVTREQGFTTMTYRAETRHHIRMGATPEGKVTAFSHEGWEVSSRPDPYVVGGTDATTRLYGYGAVASKVRIVHADRPTPGYMRSPPEVPYVFALESAMDEMAERLKMDPVEFRRRNDTMNEPIHGYPYTSRALMRCYDEAAKAFRWSERRPEPRSMRDGDWLIGLGCATTLYPTQIGPSTARVRLTPSGRVLVQTATHEIGTGVRTIASQLAAERLGLDLSAVSIEVGDSALPPAPVAGGSNSTASVCSTIIKACDQVRTRLFQAATSAGPLAGQPVDQLDLKDGRVIAPNGASASLAEVFQTGGLGTIEEYAEFVPEDAPSDAVKKLYEGQTVLVGGSKGKSMKFAFGAEFVEVRINARTREIRAPRLVGAFAAGRIMNTRTAHSQLMGGLIWGMSAALLESTEIDRRNARVVNRDIADYLMPVNADVGDVEVILLSEEDPKVNPAGVKGLGELGNVGTNAAIANAVYHATGKRIRDLPIRIEDLLEV